MSVVSTYGIHRIESGKSTTICGLDPALLDPRLYGECAACYADVDLDKRNPFAVALSKLLDLADALPAGSQTRRDVERAARDAKAESYLDAEGLVSGHPFAPRRGTTIDRTFCRDCTWHRDKHRERTPA